MTGPLKTFGDSPAALVLYKIANEEGELQRVSNFLCPYFEALNSIENDVASHNSKKLLLKATFEMYKGYMTHYKEKPYYSFLNNVVCMKKRVFERKLIATNKANREFLRRK